MTTRTHMYREIREIPGVVGELLNKGRTAIKATADVLRGVEPSIHAFIERLAVERGVNPDIPRSLKKVTETI